MTRGCASARPVEVDAVPRAVAHPASGAESGAVLRGVCGLRVSADGARTLRGRLRTVVDTSLLDRTAVGHEDRETMNVFPTSHDGAGALMRRARETAKRVSMKALAYGRFRPSESIVLTSSPRSGSTLLGQILASIPRSCVLFEPLHLVRVPGAAQAGFGWRTYVEADAEWRAGQRFLESVLQGKVVNDWTAREMSLRQLIRANRLIVKFVRANRMLPWMCEALDLRSPILLIRHPCSVISSQLAYGWDSAKRPSSPPFLDDSPRFRKIISRASSVEEFLAITWALDHLPIFLQPRPHPWVTITYEDLVSRPRPVLANLFETLQVDVDLDQAVSKLDQPSSVVRRNLGVSGVRGWREKLTETQVAGILDTVQAFGLSFYTREDQADRRRLDDPQLPEQIRAAGRD